MNNSKVKVAVRVRPLNQREKGLNSECIVRVTGNHSTLLPPSSSKERKESHIFTFDNCLQSEYSHDAGQEEVFKHLGDGVLDNIWHGYNVCIFAYGQTGSGKTFSMMGTDDQPGITPRICSALFNRESGVFETIRIEASYFEIYNEEVRDLLRSVKKQKKLRVREDRLLGPYVEELSCHAVQSYREIKLLLDQGNKQRAIAETKMNDQSSRSHAILTLTVTQTCNDCKSGASRGLVSKVSLVDLAGSERSNKSGAHGTQLKESSNINKSLSTLGLVINSLAEISENKRRSQYVNYRDSVLTWLLKNNLGGNSKTIMLATVSPAADNYHETLSTLRYADSAKRIVNQAVVNEDVKFKAIEELQEEIKRLRLQLTTTEQVKEAEVQELKAQLEEKECLLRDLETSWEEKLKRTEVATQEWRKNLEKMGVTLNKQDVVFSNQCYLIQPGAELIIHNLEATTKVGSGPSQDIQVSGAECEHCIIRKTKDGEVFLNPNGNSKTYVNGFLAEAMTQIWHEDKIQLGTNVFILHLPDRPNPGHRKEDVSRETDVQMYGELNIENDRLSITSGIYSRNGSLIGDEKSKTIEGLTQTVPASNEDFSCSENKHISDMFTQISDGTNSQLTDVSVNTTRNTESEYLEIGVGTQVQNRMIQCPPGYGETSYETSASLKSSHLFWNVPDLGNHITLPSSGKEKNSQGIFCWDKDIDLQWLTDLLPRTSISAASVCCISHPPGDYWKFEVQKFSPIILCHSFTTMAKWTQLEEFLKHCIDMCVMFITCPGKRVIVIMANVIDSEFEEKVRSDWRKWKFSGCDLITLTRQEMDAVGTYRSGLRRAMTEKIKMLKEILRLSTERIPVSWPWQMFQVKKANIGIFSRSSGDDYSWLVKLLRSADFRDWVQSVTPYYISNNGYQRFRDDVSQCTFGILYHTKNGGSINMIDGTDYLYEEELKYLHDRLGKNNVIMLIDDVEDDNLEKGWIFENQSGALGFVRDLFLISHNEKLSKFDLQHKINLELKLAQLEYILKGNSTQLGFSQ
ncbi:kinesin-like protein KIF13A [Pyxicephalus adspersus]|uniref:kinesin-like protein KIF13A n=1 Tax=Pyxicephalus adspersus TaxID=30357 RepID=UPI003B5B4286